MYACVRILNPTKIGKILDIDTTLFELYMRRIVISLLLLFATIAANVVAAENIAQGVKVVVIDAGHGGPKYPGASYRGVTEKSLNLAVALKLGKLIEERMPGVKVVYTRTTDMQFSSDLNKDLQARAEIANKAGGDIFISIHANAARSTSARGVETLIMGESPLEQRVNESVLFANNKDEFIDMSNEKTAAVVRAYIQNLQFTYGEYSEMMARLIQKNYAKSGRVARGIKRQPLKVLYATDMPSVLTEIGFMSNPDELKYISSEKGQAEIAENLYNAVKEYSDFVRKSLLIEEPTKSASTVKSESQQAADVAKSVATMTVKATNESVAVTKPEVKANVPVEKPKDAAEVKNINTEKLKSAAVAVINPAVERVETAPKAEQPKAAVKANVPVEKPKDAAEVKNINTERLKSAAVAVINPAVERVETTPKAEPMKPEQMKPGKSEPVVVKPVYDAPKPATTPASKPTQQPNGRAFVVQIMASATPLSIDDARFGKQQGKVCQYVADGAYKYKYCVGRYADRAAAQHAATALRLEFSGAFVIEVEGQNVVKR